jgi:REP element-mobilizing transposase RayT
MRPQHVTVEEGFYFLTTHCVKGVRPFLNENACAAFRDVLKQKQNQFRFRLFAYVIMPNHTHLLLQLPNGTTISKLMNHINGASARKINMILHTKPDHIWQGGFHDTVVRSAHEFATKVNYAHDNPVKWNLVKNPEEYDFSSARFFLETSGSPYLPADGFDDFGLMGFLNSVYTVLL